MLLYVNCFYDFSRALYTSPITDWTAETWSRPSLLQKVRDSKICRLCRNVFANFQKSFEVEILRIFGFFHTCLCYFLLADTTNKKHVELKTHHSAILFQHSKSQDNRFEIDPKVQHFRILTYCCKILQLIVA